MLPGGLVLDTPHEVGFTAPARTTGTQHSGAGTRGVRGHHGNFSQGGRIGYANGEFVDEDVNIQGPGFDVNEKY